MRVWEISELSSSSIVAAGKEKGVDVHLNVKCIKMIALPTGREMNSLAWQTKDRLVGAMGMKVVAFDMDMSRNKVLLNADKDCTMDLEVPSNEEGNEINKISAHPTLDQLCMCDDAGNVHVVVVSDGKLVLAKTVLAHENVRLFLYYC